MVRILSWILLFVLITFVGFCIANAIYFTKIHNSTEDNPSVSKHTAHTMVVINETMIIVQIIFIIIIIVYLSKGYGEDSPPSESSKHEKASKHE